MGLYSDNVNVNDTERVEAIDKKVLRDAKIIANIVLPKLLNEGNVHNNEENEGVGANNACCDSQQQSLPENRCEDEYNPEQPEK
jgi:peptidoglycan hydrolase CwlO-like protein